MRNEPALLVKGQPFLQRPRLDGLLESALQNPVVLMTAGPGYGKTQAAAGFLRGYDAVTIWTPLSKEDNLGWSFWEHYTGAVSQMNGSLGARLAELGLPETLRQFDRYMTLLYDETRPRKKYVTVFDDFHRIRDPAILLFFERLLAVPPVNAVTVLISRTEPALNTVPLLSRGILARITIDELRFSPEEIGRYFHLRNIPLTGEDAAQIYQDTEGWALAVDLIAGEMKAANGGAGPHIPSSKGSLKNMVETLFAAMGEVQRTFLIKLSLIDNWPLELLAELPETAACLEDMDSLSAFIRYDTSLQICRVHHLFMKFLGDKRGELPGGEIRRIYTRAAEWCLKNKLRLDAAANYEKAGDYRGLLAVIDSLPRIPPKRVSAFLLEIIERITAPPNLPPGADTTDTTEELLLLQHSVRPRLLMCLGRFDESAEASRKAAGQFEALPPGPRRSRILQAAYNNLGALGFIMCRYTRDYNCAHYFERAYGYYREYPEPGGRQFTQSSLSSYIIQVGAPAAPGEIEGAINTIADAVACAARSMNGCFYGTDALARAELAYYQVDLINAEKFARQAVYQGREKKQYEVENRALFYLMRIAIHSGDLAAIGEFQKQLEAQLDIPDYLNRYTIHDIGMGRFYAQIGLTGKIAPWLRGEYEEGELNALFHNFDILVRAWRLFSEKQYAGVLTILQNGEYWRELESFLLGKLEKTILEAVTQYRLGEEDRALADLEKAYILAAPNALDMPFIEMGEDMRLLAGTALSREDPEPGNIPRSWLEHIRGRASAYSKKLLSAMKHYGEGKGSGTRPLIYLTYRERRVLSGLARGLTRQQIAAETGLSLNTVRAVISVIYGKLGAVNRADAVRIAINMKFVKIR
jgi:LuxR family maltose regulon positive regulatory protein